MNLYQAIISPFTVDASLRPRREADPLMMCLSTSISISCCLALFYSEPRVTFFILQTLIAFVYSECYLFDDALVKSGQSYLHAEFFSVSFPDSFSEAGSKSKPALVLLSSVSPAPGLRQSANRNMYVILELLTSLHILVEDSHSLKTSSGDPRPLALSQRTSYCDGESYITLVYSQRLRT